MASLQSLPAELVHRIVESLCVHCTGPPLGSCSCGRFTVSYGCCCPDRPPPLQEAIREQTLALSALCLTSRRLRDVATGPLYHCPNNAKWWLLADTLLARPDLTKHVKQLHLPESVGFPESSSAIPPRVVSYHQTSIDAYMVSHPDNSEFLTAMNDDPLVSGNGNAHVDILASLCPSIEKVEAYVGYDPLCLFSAPGSMPDLHTAVFAFADTENGISLGDLVHVFEAAPNLRALRSGPMSDEGDEDGQVLPTMKKLREVEFQYSSISATALRDLLRACPALEAFKYDAGGACIGFEQFTPSEARDMLIEFGGDKLKKVTLELANGAESWEDWDSDEEDGVREAFEERGIELDWTREHG